MQLLASEIFYLRFSLATQSSDINGWSLVSGITLVIEQQVYKRLVSCLILKNKNEVHSAPLLMYTGKQVQCFERTPLLLLY